MPDITDNEPASMKGLHTFRPVVTARGCLFCRHQVDDHTGKALGVRLRDGSIAGTCYAPSSATPAPPKKPRSR